MTQSRGQHSSAPIPKIGVDGGDCAKLGIALLMGNVAVIVCVLSAKTPAARLPERALLLYVIGMRLIALETIRKLGFASPAPLA